jgi:hypothetical protein
LWQKHLKPVKPTFWVFCHRENGNLEILSLPDFSLRFVVQSFPLAHDVLVDTLHATGKPSIIRYFLMAVLIWLVRLIDVIKEYSVFS